MKELKKQLTKDAWYINQAIAKELGLYSALVLAYLTEVMNNENSKTISQTYKEMQDELSISEYSIKSSINRLKEAGLITVERQGIGYNNYYTLNEVL